MPRSVRRAPEVLDLFSVGRPYWGPSEVAVQCWGSRSQSAHALLGELARAGLTERLPCGRHRLGWRLVGLARTMLQTNGYRESVAPGARALAAHFGEQLLARRHARARERCVRRQRAPGWRRRRAASPGRGRAHAAGRRRRSPSTPASLSDRSARWTEWSALPPGCARAPRRRRRRSDYARRASASRRGATSTRGRSPRRASACPAPFGSSERCWPRKPWRGTLSACRCRAARSTIYAQPT